MSFFLQETIQNVATEGGLDSFPEETKWQIRLLLPNLRPDNVMNQLQPAQGSQDPAATLPPTDSLLPSSTAQQSKQEVDAAQGLAQSSEFRPGDILVPSSQNGYHLFISTYPKNEIFPIQRVHRFAQSAHLLSSMCFYRRAARLCKWVCHARRRFFVGKHAAFGTRRG